MKLVSLETDEIAIRVILVSLLLTLNIFHITPCYSVSIVNFQHVNADWDIVICVKRTFSIHKLEKYEQVSTSLKFFEVQNFLVIKSNYKFELGKMTSLLLSLLVSLLFCKRIRFPKSCLQILQIDYLRLS